MLHSPTAAVILILLAGGVNVLRDHLSLVLLVVFFMLIGKSLLEQNTSVQYRCLRCGTTREDMHSNWCEDRKK